jgi:hypothetical protein
MEEPQPIAVPPPAGPPPQPNLTPQAGPVPTGEQPTVPHQASPAEAPTRPASMTIDGVVLTEATVREPFASPGEPPSVHVGPTENAGRTEMLLPAVITSVEYPPAPKRSLLGRNRRPLIIGAVATVIVLVATVFIVLAYQRPNDPRSVAEAYFDAAEKGDIKGMQAAVCDAERNSVGADQGQASAIFNPYRGSVRFTVLDVTQQTDVRATVSVKFTVSTADGSASSTSSVPLIRENGEWKICYG